MPIITGWGGTFIYRYNNHVFCHIQSSFFKMNRFCPMDECGRIVAKITRGIESRSQFYTDFTQATIKTTPVSLLTRLAKQVTWVQFAGQHL